MSFGINRSTLESEIMDALSDMVASSCPSMRAVWLRHSRNARKLVFGSDGASAGLLDERYPAALLGYTKGSRSKYGALAGWRHCVVWRDVATQLLRHVSPEAIDALERVYFSSYELDAPPFCYSRNVSDIVRRGETRSGLKGLAQEGAKASVEALRLEYDRSGGLGEDDALEFLALGLKKSLVDVLKIEDHVDEEWLERQFDLDGIVEQVGETSD